MGGTESYENYPAWIILSSNLFMISIYAISTYIMLGLGVLAAVAYLFYCLLLEFRLLRSSCRHCFYYGRLCFYGRGKICPVAFKKGNPKVFVETEFSWAKLIPDFMVSLIPLAGGAILLVKSFSWVLLGLMITLGILAFPGNAFMRGSLACKHCRQMELGCSAERFFSKKEN